MSWMTSTSSAPRGSGHLWRRIWVRQEDYVAVKRPDGTIAKVRWFT